MTQPAPAPQWSEVVFQKGRFGYATSDLAKYAAFGREAIRFILFDNPPKHTPER